jgi:hypothetical protein
MADIEQRLGNLEQLARDDGEQPEDILITCLTEQSVRGADDVMISVHKEPTGYTEVQWGPPTKNGARIGIRYAKYDGEGPGNWNQNVPSTDVAEDVEDKTSN